MRILHVVQSLDPAWGGIARVLPLLASELAAAGETCCIATLQGGRFGMAPDVPGVTGLTFEPSRGSGGPGRLLPRSTAWCANQMSSICTDSGRGRTGRRAKPRDASASPTS